MSSKKPILIINGDPKSIFLEIFLKSINKINFKTPIILIASYKLLSIEKKNQKIKKKIKIIEYPNFDIQSLNNTNINLINIDNNDNDTFDYINKSFEIAFKIIKKYKLKKFINGPINKKNFLNKKYLGITEYIAKKFKIKESAMLIYNKKLSVCPVTTHLPIKYVAKSINKEKIEEKIILINKFYKNTFKFKPKIAVLGLNPHCESIDKFNEDDKIIKPLIFKLKKKNFLVDGPISGDTIFLSQNRCNYDV
uniref:4-hydroxythreonine-4-phosphate dehydrogenase PdxA n=1 Tax=Pelagibacter ubique TaxID=198252 RepID=UPI00094C6068